MHLTTQSTAIHVEATKFPPCSCGHAYTAHHCQAFAPVGREPCECHGYSAHGRIEWLGVRAKTYAGSMPFFRRMACEMLWTAELRIQRWRERLEQP